VIKDGPTIYQPSSDAFMPVEFSAAAYRWGHSAVRERYDYNRVFTPKEGGVTPASLSLLFRFTGFSSGGTSVPIPSDWIIDWRRFYEVESGFEPGRSRLIDPLLSPKLHKLPSADEISGKPPEGDGESETKPSLPRLNLRRGRSLGLPPGQSIARNLGIAIVPEKKLTSGKDGEVAKKHSFHLESPLWWYILKEAEAFGEGKHLGPLGSRILAEVFVGLLLKDSSSFLSRNPGWKPTLPGAKSGHFTMADLINFVGDVNPIGNKPGGGN
jgi:hypothetical protein